MAKAKAFLTSRKAVPLAKNGVPSAAHPPPFLAAASAPGVRVDTPPAPIKAVAIPFHVGTGATPTAAPAAALFKQMRGAPRGEREGIAVRMCQALQAKLGTDAPLADYRREPDPEKRARMAAQIISKRDEPRGDESALRHLLAQFIAVPALRAELLPQISFAAHRAGLLSS